MKITQIKTFSNWENANNETQKSLLILYKGRMAVTSGICPKKNFKIQRMRLIELINYCVLPLPPMRKTKIVCFCHAALIPKRTTKIAPESLFTYTEKYMYLMLNRNVVPPVINLSPMLVM